MNRLGRSQLWLDLNHTSSYCHRMSTRWRLSYDSEKAFRLWSDQRVIKCGRGYHDRSPSTRPHISDPEHAGTMQHATIMPVTTAHPACCCTTTWMINQANAMQESRGTWLRWFSPSLNKLTDTGTIPGGQGGPFVRYPTKNRGSTAPTTKTTAVRHQHHGHQDIQ